MRSSSGPFEGGEEHRGSCVVAKGLAEVGEAIDIPRTKNEAAAKLKGIPPKFVLAMPCGASAITAPGIVAAKQVKHIGDAQAGKFVSLALFVDEQREVDSCFFLEDTGIVAVAKADGCEGSAFIDKSLLVFAQLRDVLAAEDSPIVAKKNDNRRLVIPQRSQPNFPARSVGKNHVRQPLTEIFHDHGLFSCLQPIASRKARVGDHLSPSGATVRASQKEGQNRQP